MEAQPEAETFGLLTDVEAAAEDAHESWPMIHPPTKRSSKYFCCGSKLGCCPCYPLCVVPLALLAWALGFVLIACVIALALCLYALCGYPLCMARMWLKTWSFGATDYRSTLYVQIVTLIYQGLLIGRARPSTGPDGMPIESLRPKRPLRKNQVSFAVSIEVPSGMEEEFLKDQPIAAAIYDRLVNRLADSAFLDDDFTAFKPGEDPVKYAMKHIGHLYPYFVDSWEDKQSDRALTRFCLHGLAAHRVERTELNGTPHYVVRCNMLSKVPVRKGYARYGGDVFFDMNWRPVQIVDEGICELRPDGTSETRITKPGEKGWHEAKFRFRSSLSALVTLVDHLYGVHLQMSNLVVTSLREQLSPEHPVRRFMTPFTYQTITVNDNARNNLIELDSMGPRCFGFTNIGIQMAFAAAKKMMVYGFEVPKEEGGPLLDRVKYHEWLKGKGVDTEYGRQNAQLGLIFRKFVSDYLAYYYPTEDELLNDKELESFVQAFFNKSEVHQTADANLPIHHAHSKEHFNSGEDEREFLVTLLAEFMWTVTSAHEHVGNLSPYVQDVSFCAFRWVPGATMGTKQTATNQATLMAFTSTPMPVLLGSDWTHLFPEKTSPPSGVKTPVQVFKAFQEELEAMAVKCDEWNAKASERPFPECFTMYSCHPRYLEMSISV